MSPLRPRRSIVIAALAVALVVAPATHAQSDPSVIGIGIDGLATWLDFARNHKPGAFDAALIQQRKIGVERHFALAPDLAALIEYLKDPTLNGLRKPGRRFWNEELEQLKRIAIKERAAGTTDSLLRKIALLETDGV